MLNEHTLDQLKSLRLDGMVRAIEEQASSTAADALAFDDRLTLLVQREVAWRDDRRVARLLKAARLKVASACIERFHVRGCTVRLTKQNLAWPTGGRVTVEVTRTAPAGATRARRARK